MTSGPRSQCDACSRLKPRANFDDPQTCTAFPRGIPGPVYDNEVDHRQPIPGDNALQFKAKAGDEFPAYAFRFSSR